MGKNGRKMDFGPTGNKGKKWPKHGKMAQKWVKNGHFPIFSPFSPFSRWGQNPFFGHFLRENRENCQTLDFSRGCLVNFTLPGLRCHALQIRAFSSLASLFGGRRKKENLLFLKPLKPWKEGKNTLKITKETPESNKNKEVKKTVFFWKKTEKKTLRKPRKFERATSYQTCKSLAKKGKRWKHQWNSQKRTNEMTKKKHKETKTPGIDAAFIRRQALMLGIAGSTSAAGVLSNEKPAAALSDENRIALFQNQVRDLYPPPAKNGGSYAAPIGAFFCPEIRAFTGFWGEISSTASKALSDRKVLLKHKNGRW